MVQHCVGRRKAWIRNERQMRRRVSRHTCAIGMEGQIRKANCSLQMNPKPELHLISFRRGFEILDGLPRACLVLVSSPVPYPV